MEDNPQKKSHSKRHAGRKADKKKAKSKHEQELTPQQRNPKAFSIQHAQKTLKIVQRTQDLKTKKHHIPVVDRTPVEPPPVIIGVVGPPKVGKTTLLKCLVKNFTKQKLSNIQGPVTVVSGKHRRLTFLECNNDINSMIDIAKVADLVLLLVDASFGFEMETFEFLNICQVHGFPRIMGVLTHLDFFRDNKRMRKTKKRLKHRFWTEVYQGAKLFYLSGMVNDEYQKTEVHNLCRFISVMKFRPLTWRTTHPYILADRMEDITDPEKIRKSDKCDRNVSLYGYVHGTHMKNNISIHIPGCGDFTIQDMQHIPDPCPTPDSMKKRSLNQRERIMYAPMSGVGGIVYDKDAVYIDLGGSHFHKNAEKNSDQPANELVSTLMSMTNPLDEKMTSSKVTVFSEAISGATNESGSDSAQKSVLIQAEDGRMRRKAVFDDEEDEDSEDEDDSDEAEGDEDEQDEESDEGIQKDLPPKKKSRKSVEDEELAFADDDDDLDLGSSIQMLTQSSRPTSKLSSRDSGKSEEGDSDDDEEDGDDDSDDDDDDENTDEFGDESEEEDDSDESANDSDENEDDIAEIQDKFKSHSSVSSVKSSETSQKARTSKQKSEIDVHVGPQRTSKLKSGSSKSCLSSQENRKLESKSRTKLKPSKVVDESADEDSVEEDDNIEDLSGEDSEEDEVESGGDTEEDEVESDEDTNEEDSGDNSEDGIDEEMKDVEEDRHEVEAMEEEEGDLKWKSNITAMAAEAFRRRQVERVNYRKLVYGQDASENKEVDDEEDEDGLGGLFRVLREKNENARQSRSLTNQADCSKFTRESNHDWNLEEVRELIKDCFVTGKWEGAEDAETLLKQDDEMFGDFEDLETGEVHSGKVQSKGGDDDEEEMDEKEDREADKTGTDEVKKKKSEMTAMEKRLERKRKLKEMFDTQYDMKGDTEFFDAWKAELEEQAKLNRSEFENLEDELRVQYEGFRPGMYVRVEISGVPCEFVTNFDPTYPLIVGGLLSIEENVGYVQTRVKKHRWYKKILKTRNPLIISLGWRRFQTMPLYSIQDHNMRHRLLKYTPEHLHCHASFWGPITPQGTGMLAVESVAGTQPGFRIAATGVVLELDKSLQIVKKLKLTGTPFKIFRKTAFIQGMFNSSLEVSKFEGASIKTVSGIRGQIKKQVKSPEGAFRATFEDKIILSDIVFLRTWFPVEVPQFYNPVTSLLLPPAEKTAWLGMKTVGQLRREKNQKAPQREDSKYKVVERPRKGITPVVIPKDLQQALPFKDTPKILQPKGDPYKRVSVIREPHEAKVAKLMKMLRTLHEHKNRVEHRNMRVRAQKHQQAMEKLESVKDRKNKDRKKRLFRAMGKLEKGRDKYKE